MTHFFSQYEPTDPDVIRCNTLAAETWARLPWAEKPIPDAILPRMFTLDGKTMPYMKDVFDMAVQNEPDQEIMVFTNLDIQVRADAFWVIACQLQGSDAAYCFRRDFPPKQTAIIPDEKYTSGHAYSGSDMYAFRAGWWRSHREDMPDMILGNELWDAILRHLIDATNPYGRTAMRDLIAHEKAGASWWEKPENRYTLKGQIHNLTLGTQYLAKRGIPISRHGIPYDFMRRGRRRFRQ